MPSACAHRALGPHPPLCAAPAHTLLCAAGAAAPRRRRGRRERKETQRRREHEIGARSAAPAATLALSPARPAWCKPRHRRGVHGGGRRGAGTGHTSTPFFFSREWSLFTSSALTPFASLAPLCVACATQPASPAHTRTHTRHPSTMPRRGGGGGRSRSPPPRARSPAPPPAPRAPAPPPAQQRPSMGQGLGGMVASGMALGTGSALAHRAVDAVLGSRHPPPADAVAAAGAVAADDADPCRKKGGRGRGFGGVAGAALC